MTGTIDALATRALDLHRSATERALPHLVVPSLPELYVGNRAKYLESETRVVTVALNPSKDEFPAGDAFQRFPGGEEVGTNVGKYLALLDAYFDNAPNRKWFDGSFEPLLAGFGSSFFGEAKSTAIHTNLASPLCTDPAWSRLGEREQAALQVEGVRLWHDLMNELDPDIILVSVSRQYLKSITFDRLGVSDDVAIVERASKPYVFEGWRIKLGSGKKSHLVFGMASQTPFGTVKKTDKDRIGKEIAEWMTPAEV